MRRKEKKKVSVRVGHEPRTTPGQTLAVQSDKPFTGLTSFGSSFLSKFEAGSDTVYSLTRSFVYL